MPLRTFVLAALTLNLLAPQPAQACTTFALVRKSDLVVGKSYDFDTGDGLLMINKRGVTKQAAIVGAAQPARWVSRYGSVTFNQYGREHPLGGMNEKGLVVEIMWLSAAQFGTPKREQPTVNELQWIQVLIDTAATVEQAISTARRLQVSKVYAAVHYMVCDASSACATFEHLDGKLVVHSGKRLPARVLTNDTYEKSARSLRARTGRGQAIPTSSASLDRFVRAAVLVRDGQQATTPAVATAFGVLERVQMGSFSKWQIVYEPRHGRIHFRNAGERSALLIDARAQDYRCTTPVRVMDLRGTLLGQRGRWAAYSAANNLALIRRNLAAINNPLPPAVIQQLAAYPEQATRCGAQM